MSSGIEVQKRVSLYTNVGNAIHGRRTSRILLADDDDETTKNHRHALSNFGFDVHSVRGFEQVPETACNELPDLIILVWDSGSNDALETSRLLKQSPETQGIPVVFFTKPASFVRIASAYATGVSDVIYDNASPLELNKRLGAQIRVRELSRRLESAETRLYRERVERLKAERELALYRQDRDVQAMFSQNVGSSDANRSHTTSPHQRRLQELVENEKFFRRIVNTAHEGIWVIDEAGVTTYVNRRMADMLGYDIDEMLGETMFEFMDSSAVQEANRNFERRKSGVAENHEFRLRTKSGRQLSTLMVTNPLTDEEGTFIGALAMVSDISEQRNAQNALQASEERYRELYNKTPAMMHTIDSRGTIVSVSDYWLKTMGYRRDEVVGKKATGFLTEESRKKAEDTEIPRFLRKGHASNVSYNFCKKNGEVVEVLLSAVAEHSENGQVVRGLAISVDVTEFNRAERELQANRERYRLLYNETPAMLHSIDSSGHIISVSDYWLKTMGYERDEVIGRPSTDFLTDESRRKAKNETLVDFFKTGICRDVAYQYVRKDGEILDVLLSATAECNDEGAITNSLAVSVDITARKRAETALQESSELFRRAFEDALIATALVTKTGTFMRVNPLFVQLFGYSEEELLQLSFKELTYTDDREESFSSFQDLLRGRVQSFTLEKRYVKKDKSIIWAHTAASAVHDEHGRFKYAIAMINDISASKKAELEREKLLEALSAQNDELESIVYVTSHDLRSPLVNIQGFSAELAYCCRQLEKNWLQKGAESGSTETVGELLMDDIPTALQYIRVSTEKMDQLLKGLSRISRLGRMELDVHKLDMNAMMQKIVDSMQYRIKETGVEVTVGYLPDCYGDSGQINQVFSNLIDNAIKYLDTRRRGKVEISGELKGNTVYYYVRDNGIGINDAHQPKVFELFHRLNPKDSIKGEGLGLTIVRRLVKRHGGDVAVESTVGIGACFTITLPVLVDHLLPLSHHEEQGKQGHS